MQSISPVTAAELLAPVQRMRYKLELYDDTPIPPAWAVTGQCVVISPTEISKVGGGSFYDSRANSVSGFVPVCVLQFRPAQSNLRVTMGLSHDITTTTYWDYENIDFAWDMDGDGNAYMFEAGSFIGAFGPYSSSTVFSITYDGVNVRYYLNGVLKHMTARAVGAPLYMRASYCDPGAIVEDIAFGPALPYIVGWLDLSSLGGQDYLKSVSLSLGGAGMEPDPIGGTWSATIDNPNGIFHPLHPTSPYAGLLRIGREVRISVGANYGAGAGTDYYWQRLIGFMDAPRFDHGSKTVEISGMDYMKLLADTTLADSLLVGESGSGSGSVGADDEVDGPTHWGRRAQLDSVASFTESGAELYTLGDAMDKVSPTNSIDGGWGPDGNIDFTSVGVGPGNWCGHMRLNAGTSGKVTFAGLLGLTAGDRYIVKVRLYKYMGGGWKVTLSEAGDELASSWVPTTGSWLTLYFSIIAPSTGNLDLEIAVQAASGTYYLNVDWLSIHKCIPNWNRYQLPVECNGPWYVALDGVQLTQGHRDVDGHFDGWIYDEENHLFYFDEERIIDLGSENLWIYYYTDQILDNVVADILAICGLYVDRAAALADMDYTPAGITIGRVWFDSGGTALDAIRRICERANYRFWFSWDGTPCFKPAPVATSPSFVFAEPSHLEALSDFQDLETVHNHVTIEGSERAMFDMSREDQSKDVFKGEASEPASIAAYLEKAESIKNTLFQDQASTDAMCAALVAADKDPKWFASLGLAFNPVPLELGDTIEWPLELEPAAEADSDSGRLIVTVEGIIRDIKLNDGKSTYNCEVIP